VSVASWRGKAEARFRVPGLAPEAVKRRVSARPMPVAQGWQRASLQAIADVFFELGAAFLMRFPGRLAPRTH